MAILPYDVNSYLKTHADLAGYNLEFVPLNDPEPCDGSGNPLGVPYIRYFWSPNILSMNKYFIRTDRIRYYIMSRDYDKGWQLADKITQILNPKDIAGGHHQIPCDDGTNRILSSRTTGSNTAAPTQLGGHAQTMLEFEFRYVRD